MDIYASPESLRDQQQHSVGTEESSKSLGTGRSQRPDAVSPPWCPIRAVVVLLGLLSVVLLAGLLGFAVKFKADVRKTVNIFYIAFGLKVSVATPQILQLPSFKLQCLP